MRAIWIAPVPGSENLTWYTYALKGKRVLWAYAPGQEQAAWRYEAEVLRRG